MSGSDNVGNCQLGYCCTSLSLVLCRHANLGIVVRTTVRHCRLYCVRGHANLGILYCFSVNVTCTVSVDMPTWVYCTVSTSVSYVLCLWTCQLGYFTTVRHCHLYCVREHANLGILYCFYVNVTCTVSVDMPTWVLYYSPSLSPVLCLWTVSLSDLPSPPPPPPPPPAPRT